MRLHIYVNKTFWKTLTSIIQQYHSIVVTGGSEQCDRGCYDIKSLTTTNSHWQQGKNNKKARGGIIFPNPRWYRLPISIVLNHMWTKVHLVFVEVVMRSLIGEALVMIYTRDLHTSQWMRGLWIQLKVVFISTIFVLLMWPLVILVQMYKTLCGLCFKVYKKSRYRIVLI